MIGSVRSFSAPKRGNTSEEYEDAFAIANDQSRIAIADGATETSFARLWAKLLVRTHCRARLAPWSLADSLSWPRKVWNRLVRGKPLPWYAEQKVEEGAFSSLLCLNLTRSSQSSVSWSSFAVGDSCLFHVRNNELAQSFPLEQWEQFDSRPQLLSSSLKRTADPAVAACTGEALNGDDLYLLTDAVACWALRRLSTGGNPFARLSELESDEQFDAFVRFQREECHDDGTPLMRNDDVTVVRITVGNGN